MKRNAGNNDHGMTLVELLVAMAIFAAAIVPMMYAFVYSAGFNFKSSQTMQFSGISQAIIEKCKSANTNNGDILDALADGSLLTGDNTFTVDTVDPIPGGYRLNNVHPNAVTQTNKFYDVDVVFSSVPGGIVDYSTVQSMSGNTANFCGTWTGTLAAQDEVAKNKVVELIKSQIIDTATEVRDTSNHLLSDVSPSVFTIADIPLTRVVIDREIIITAEDDRVTLKVNYYYGGYDSANPSLQVGRSGNHYPVGNPSNDTFFIIKDDYNHNGDVVDIKLTGHISGYSMADSPRNPVYSAVFANSSQPGYNAEDSNLFSFFVRDDSTDPVVSAVYFYYIPGYMYHDNSSVNFNDHFVLNNNLTSSPVDELGNDLNRLDFYLIKQYDSSNPTLKRCENAYDPYITLSDAPFDTYLYHNLLRYVDDDGDGLKSQTYSIANHFDSNISIGNNWHDCTVLKEMKETDDDALSYLEILRKTIMFKGDPSTYAAGIPVDRQFISLLLEDEASMPYRSLERDTSPKPAMYSTRSYVTVTVYPAGSSDPIESMSAMCLNW